MRSIRARRPLQIAITIGAVLAVLTMSIIVNVRSSSADEPAPPPCITQLPGTGPATWSKVPWNTTQIVFIRGVARDYDENTFERWERQNGCWVKLSAWWSLNGFNGWSQKPQTGSLMSPAGVFSLTDTGGRLPNPGTGMRYHYGPKWWHLGGYRIDYPVQLYNYVIAINFNRQIGKSPRFARQLRGGAGSGYWIHERGLGSTRGCVSLTRSELITLLRWMRPSAKPHVIMGPAPMLLR